MFKALRVYKAKRALAAYVSTLSPEQQAWATELSAKLASSDPVKVMQLESQRLREQHFRVIERLENVADRLTVTL